MATEPEKILTREEILANYENHLSSKGKTRGHYLRFAREFLEYAGGRYDRKTVEEFLKNEQEKHGYGDGSLNFAFRVVRTVFTRSKIEWPFNRGEAPVVRESSVKAPALDPRTVKRAIEAVKMHDNLPAAALLALSTTYGLRRQEMINLTSQDIRISDRTLFIATLKHGRERTHLIPEEIVPYLKLYDFDTPRTDFFMINLWYDIENMIELEHIDHVGWHSIRRTLDTILLRTFKEATVSSFMRWKQATSSNMPFRYSKTEFVGEKDSVTELGGEALSVDQQIFGKDAAGNYCHPFIGEWT